MSSPNFQSAFSIRISYVVVDGKHEIKQQTQGFFLQMSFFVSVYNYVFNSRPKKRGEGIASCWLEIVCRRRRRDWREGERKGEERRVEKNAKDPLSMMPKGEGGREDEKEQPGPGLPPS